MTEKLYRQNAYLQVFSSTVLEAQDRAVRLESTAFYPTAGGQAFDTGLLNDVRVLGVVEKDGLIWHQLESNLEVGTVVTGQLDWVRRFDHMQQHTGEHLLGQAFFRLQRDVLAVNMEHSVCTLDLTEETNWDLAMQAEKAVNEAIWAAYPIRTYEVPDTEIAAVPLRRTPKVTGLIRVVQIGDYDFSACGGTHTANSSEVGMLKIFKLERIKGGATRVYFNCGARLLEDYRAKHDFMVQLGLRFSSGIDQVPARIFAVLEELNSSKLELTRLRTALAARIASGFLKGVVVHLLEDVLLLPDLAKVCSARDNLVAVLGASDGSRAFITVTCGVATKQNAAELLKIGLPMLEGRGGGKSDLAQGSGSRVEALESALEAIGQAVNLGA
jgi:alanyl-tRNA synthetase